VLLTQRIDKLIEKLSQQLIQNHWKLVSAESCSGGLLAAKLTYFPGASNWFETSVVSYSEKAKMHFLEVDAATLKKYGAVSEACALEMVQGVRWADNHLAVAITGLAGPDGGLAKTPVGTVFIAWQAPNEKATSQGFMFMGHRQEVVLQAIFHALRGLVLKSLQQAAYQSMHFFFAIMLDDHELENELFQHALNSGLSIEQLEPACNLHVTLAYLGKTEPQALYELGQKAAYLASTQSAFTMDFESLDYWKRPDAFIYRFQDTPQTLKHLSTLGTEDVFIPHLTISKRSGVRMENIKLSAFKGQLKVKSFSLMASMSGLIYIEQAKWFLNKEIK
jgi:nicotinamide-nucleotide amidase